MWDSDINNDRCSEMCPYSTRMKKSLHERMQTDDLDMDKENQKCEEISLYGSNSPIESICTGGISPSHCSHTRKSLDDHDTNSQDSGFISENGKYLSYTSPTRGSSHSFGSGSLCSMEDEYFEYFSDVEPLDKQKNLPEDFNKLIHKPIIENNVRPLQESNKSSPSDNIIRPVFRRALSLQSPKITPNSSRVRSCLFRTSELSPPDSTDVRSFKRPEPPSNLANPNLKRSKLFDEDDIPSVPEVEHHTVPRPLLKRAFSATEESIMSAVQRSSTEPDLIGDFTKTFCLPLTRGRHQDLKSITANTLAKLMRGEFNNSVASFRVIDCRYPYEFEGGHISGAINIYTKEQCLELLCENQLPMNSTPSKRHILVFHCEFSSERGPNLYRYLRQEDRSKNESVYPSLNYPEMYLLEGGYKNFFEQFSAMCVPVAYKEMNHPDHQNDLKHFRQKSKTWNVDSRQRPYRIFNQKRLL